MTFPSSLPRRVVSRVLQQRQLSLTAFELTLDRRGLDFKAGQLLNIHGPNLLDDRSYTICSGEQDEHVQIVFRVIPTGKLTPWLAARRPGDEIELSAPFGEFVLRDASRPIVFVATGTGIAPARAYARTWPGLHFTLLHGVRTEADLFYRGEFGHLDYLPCVSTGAPGVFHGRVTDRCMTLDLSPQAHYYLCGANEMFYDMRDLLQARGVPAEHVFTEAYYYRADD